MNKLEKLIQFAKDPYYRRWVLAGKGIYDSIPDEKYIRQQYKLFTGNELNLDNPQKLSEKLQWLKIYNRHPEYTELVDKVGFKKYIKELIGEEYIIPTYGVWDKFDDINFDMLPNQFILKCTHDSGSFVICKDKSNFNVKNAKKIIEKGLKRNYYWGGREWPYKNVKPRIIAEKYISTLGKPDSIEYKTTCFNGKVEFVTICTGIAHSDYSKRTNDHFDANFNPMPWWTYYKHASVTPNKPKEWEDLIMLCEKISKDIPYARVDAYIIDDQIYFGEITFFTWSGYLKFNPEEWDEILGKRLLLPEPFEGLEL